MNIVVQRLVALGLQESAAEKLEKLVSKWAQASGPEWTVKRLKALKVELISGLAGCEVRAQWVRRNSDGLPSGPISELFRLAHKSDRGRFIAINSLMVYSSFISSQVTETQRRKFFDSMESEDSTGLTREPSRTYKVATLHDLKELSPWVNQPLSSGSFQPGPDGKSYPETDTFISFVGALASRPIASITKRYSTVFNRVIPMRVFNDMKREGVAEVKYSDPTISLCVGKISYIQEPGMKLRAVANPNRVLQAALEPLKEALGRVISQLPTDHTFDQNAGVERVQRWLSQGKTVYSVDLSDATNLFPRAYTFSVLRNRIRVTDPESARLFQSLVGIFEEVSMAPWFTKEAGKIETHTFTRGQPLGLGPSFFAFGISHNVLLMDICRDLGIEPELPFAILGDDVVIADDRLAEFYLQELQLLGCKISREKSLVSNKVAEFAGKIIFAKDVIPQFKWREITDLNFVDFLRRTGQRGLNLLSPRQRKVAELLGPVPDLIGGLGWNPEGLTFEERVQGNLFSQFMLEREQSAVLPYRRVDRGIIEFASDARFVTSAPSNYLDSASQVLPSRQDPEPSWGTSSFWEAFHIAQEKSNSLPPYRSVPESIASLRLNKLQDYVGGLVWNGVRLYVPFSKEDNDPTSLQISKLPWFELVRYFERTHQDASPRKRD